MKTRIAMAVLLLLSTAEFVLAGPFGPVTPAAKTGEISQEIGYFRSVGTWTTDSALGTGGFEDTTVTMNQAYLQAGYGLTDDWEGYFRIGGSDLNLEKAFAQDDSAMEDSVAPFVTVGTRALLHDGKIIDLGVFFQGTYFAPFEDSKTFDVGTPLTEKLQLKNLWDVNLGLALQANTGRVSAYGGPVAYYGSGRLEVESELGGQRATNSATYEERGNLGGVAGLKLKLARNIDLFLEGQYKSKLSAGGAVTYLRFDY